MDIRIDHQLFEQLKATKIEQFKQTHPTTRFKYNRHHRIYRLLIKKLRRQCARQRLAQERDEKLRLETIRQENDPLYQAWTMQREHVRQQRELEEERENEKARQLWEKRERMEVKKMQQLIARQEQRQRETRQESPVPKVLGPIHNPLQPIQTTIAASIERPVCSFYLKTGVCRFDERCHRTHHKPGITNTLLAMNMYSNFELQYGWDDEYDLDIGLEFEESERYETFKDFYFDVRPEFEKYGRVTTFKVCFNSEMHLRGNVYVQYESDDESMRAYLALNTRYYAGRMIQCQFVNIPSWTAAICGLSQYGKCPKGRRCNYLHVFRNPPVERSRSPRAHRKHKHSRSREDSKKRKRSRRS